MSWKSKAIIIWALAIPAFTGFPIYQIPGELVPGVTFGWLTYGTMVYSAIILLTGKKVFKLSLAVALTIALPLVILGTLISAIIHFITGWSQSSPADYILHYIRLMVTMLVVIPLALSMIVVIPFHLLEHHLLSGRQGVTTTEKMALMFLRVFSHIFYFVIPNILEVVKEEGILSGKRFLSRNLPDNKASLFQRIGEMVAMLINIGVDAICSAIRYIPLWAEEISRLPGSTMTEQDPDTTDQTEK